MLVSKAVFFFLGIAAFVAQAEAQQAIKIIDLAGKTQSIVELDDSDPAKMQATVRVAVLPAEATPDNLAADELKGLEISLVKVVNDREADVVQIAKTFKNGVATFNGIVPGVYKTRIECAQMIVKSAALSGSEIINRANMPEAPDPKSLDQIHLLDQTGQSRAMAEVPYGKSAALDLSVADSENKDASLKDVRVMLIDLEEDTEEEIEVYAGQVTNDEGKVSFAQVPGGLYKIRIECPRYATGGIGFNSESALSCFCPTDLLKNVPNTLSEMVAPVSSGQVYGSLLPAVAAPTATMAPVIGNQATDDGEAPSASRVSTQEQ
ncbi:MAG: hypothetical protein IT292_07755 [Deltaproteobacteria bacterium]|nr:hypothetical protein [Deltaproteobacteria bacterium]